MSMAENGGFGGPHLEICGVLDHVIHLNDVLEEMVPREQK